MAASVPFDKREGFIWLDGQMVNWQEANVHVLTHGLHYASSIFEGERAYNGRVFKLREHSQRLIESGKLLGFDIPYTVEEIDEATKAVVKANGHTDCYVRPVAWRGSEMMAVSAQHSKIHLAIACWVWPGLSDAEKRKGIRLGLTTWKRPHPQTAPTASKAAGLYMIGTLSKHEAEAAGYDDALMMDWEDNIAEATGANIFLGINGELHTPTPDCFLDGITRRTVIDLARGLGIKVVERKIKPSELDNTTEIFLTGTAAEVKPVREIAGKHFNTPGPLTEKLIQAYDKLVRAESSLEVA